MAPANSPSDSARPRGTELEETTVEKGPATMVSGEGTILIVDEDADVRALTQEILRLAGYSLLVAQDDANALRICQEYSGQIHLLLTDLALPTICSKKIGGKDGNAKDLNGIKLAARLRALRPQMKVLFMSGRARGAMLESGTLDPEANFIQKPWSPQGLWKEISRVLTTPPPPPRILVVDDEAGIREWLAEVLACSGYRVFTATDGLEAKRLARRQALDLVITDISMPNEEGLGTICALAKAHPEIKIIAISGANADLLVDAKLLGASVALAKPFTAEMVLKCVHDLSPA